MRKLVIFVSLILLMISISAVCAEEINSTEKINIVEDDNLTNSITVSGNSFDDIQKTIDKSNKHDIIELNGTYTPNNKVIVIKKPITIQGSENGAILNANNLDNVFEIEADNVILKGLTIINAKYHAVSDVSFDGKQDLTIINCTFKNNKQFSTVEYVNYDNMGTLTLINSTFDRNTGGAIEFMGKQLTVDECRFINNNVDPDEMKGGAISAYASNIMISKSNFENNYAYNGGAIYSCNANIRISECNFTSNSARNHGGAIYAEGEMESIKNENIPYTLTILNTTFNSNSAKNIGKAVYSIVYNADIENSDFKSSQDVYVKIGSLKNINNNLSDVQNINSINATLKAKHTSLMHDSYDELLVYANTENIPFLKLKIKLVLYTGKTTKTYYKNLLKEEFENVQFSLSKLPVGKYKVKIYLESKYFKAKPLTTKITVKKAKTTVKAPKVTAKYKKSKKFSVKVKHKITGKSVKNINLKIKVYTGKKSKTFTVKTNKKGVAKISTKKLRRGAHKVVITSKDKNYIVNKKSSIKIN